MEFIDLGRQYDRVKEEMDAAIHKTLQDRHFIMGPEVKELEEKYPDITWCSIYIEKNTMKIDISEGINYR